MTKKSRNKVRLIVSKYFKDSKGNPFQLTDYQCEIFVAVISKKRKWVWLSAPTRYGKSEVLALACIYLAVFENLKIPIVGGSEDKAKKIMEYITKHIGDHPELYAGLINLQGLASVEKLKISVSKETLRWSNGGWIYVTSIDSRSISKEGEKVVGEGGDVVILEEAGLIRDKDQFSKIVRMPEGEWRKLVMSGNCVEKSVFEAAYKNPLYYKIRVTLEQAIAEGRYTQDELNEKQSQTTTRDWKRYYLVEFPQAGEFGYFKPKAYEFLPNELDYYGALDPALGESNKSGSLVGIVILGQHPVTKQVYEIESIGDSTLKPEDAMRKVLNFPYKFKRFGVEAVQFQAYFKRQMDEKSKELQKYIPFVGIQQKRKKEERIESVEPIVNTGIVLFKEGSLLWQHMQDYPDLDKLDVLDTFEMVCRLMNLSGYDPKRDASRIIV
jgi:predicted phage terminase large subunit-like protein